MSLTEHIATNPAPVNTQQEPIHLPEPGPSALDQDLAQFTKDIEAEYRAADLDEQTKPVEEGAQGLQIITDPPTPVPEPKKDESIDQVVQRELGLRLREDKVSGYERREQELTARIRELEQHQAPDDLVTEMRLRPHDTWAKMGLDPDDVIRMALAQKLEKLGQPVDPALRNKLDQSNTQIQIRALEQKVISQERERASREYQERVALQAREWMGKDLAVSAPTIADVAKASPDRIHAEIMQEIMVDARLRAKMDPNGPLLTFPEAAKRVAARWDDYRKALSPAGSAIGTVQSNQPAIPAQKQAEQKKTTVVQPPDRPLAPWLKKIDVQEQGIRDALDEFRRVDATRK